MNTTIELFMWGFQAHFRIGVKVAFESALARLGLEVEPKVFLVGLLQEAGKGHALCIEPEDDELQPADFSGLADRASVLFDADPETKILHSDQRTHRLRQTSLLRGATAAAISEVLSARTSLEYFVAMPARVDAYSVYTAIGLPRDALAAVPSLESAHAADDDRLRLTRSLIDAAIVEFLPAVTRSLYRPDPGSTLGGPVEADELARLAGARLAMDIAYRADSSMPSHGFFQAMNELATTRYERRTGLGRLALVRQGSDDVDAVLTLKRPISIRQTRTLRKLLETSTTDGAAVLTNGTDAYGLGSINLGYRPPSERAFEVAISGLGSWDLRHAGTPLMSVLHGSPHLPSARLSRSKFQDVAERVFKTRGGADTARLWDYATAAADAEHGTMLVICADAASEAERLEGQAFTTQSAKTDPGLIRQASHIDGAILVDPRGELAAIGVILDGVATGQGDRSRGARFNSAVRYLAATRSPTMIVLVSEDGMLDLLPNLRPQIRRDDVDAALESLRYAAGLSPVDRPRFSGALDRVRAIAFYLSATQCDEVNSLVQTQQERERDAGFTVWIVERPLKPDPIMSDEYFRE